MYTTIVAAINATGWLNIQLTYLLLYPEYICEELKDGKWVSIAVNDPHC